jgi:hypothetical protein
MSLRSRHWGAWTAGAAAGVYMLLCAEGSARAQQPGATDSVDLQLHGFVSQGFLVTTDNNYLAESQQGSFEFAEVGFNVTSAVTDQLRVGIQLFARDLGPIGDYQAHVDWFYLDYRWKDWLGVRAGRVKLPFGLYNDVADIDAAHSVVLLPQSIYPASNRDFLLAQTGVELYGYRDLGSSGALDYRVYGGTIFLQVSDQPGRPYDIARLTVPYVAGARLMWEPRIEGLRVGGSVQALRLESDLLFDMAAAPIEVDVPAVLWVGSLEYTARDWMFAAEYSRWHTKLESSDPMLFPETKTVSERGYALAAYRLTPIAQASLYYSLLYPDTEDRSGADAQQHDVAAAVRFDLNLNWLLKLEAHYMHGTAGLSNSLNSGPPDELAEDWAVFLAKTTAYF